MSAPSRIVELNENYEAAHRLTPAEHMTKIKELVKAIELGAQDLQDLLDAPAFTFDKDGKMIL